MHLNVCKVMPGLTVTAQSKHMTQQRVTCQVWDSFLMVRCQVSYYTCLGLSPTLGNSLIPLSHCIYQQRLSFLLPLRRVNALLLIFEICFFFGKKYYFDRICLNCRFVTLSVAPPVLLRHGWDYCCWLDFYLFRILYSLLSFY